jgi:hypothetical protein
MDAFLTKSVAAALRFLADQVEAENVQKLTLVWNGGAEIETEMTLREPLKLITAQSPVPFQVQRGGK